MLLCTHTTWQHVCQQLIVCQQSITNPTCMHTTWQCVCVSSVSQTPHVHPHYLAVCVSADKTTNSYSTSDISVLQPCTDQVKGARVSSVHAGHAGSVGRHQLVILFIRYLHWCTPPCPARQTTLLIAWLNWLIPTMATAALRRRKKKKASLKQK